jgi:ABC-type uncharacterized transport system permease subunit
MKRFGEDFTPLDGELFRHCIRELDMEGEWPEKYKKAIMPYSLFDDGNLFGKPKFPGLMGVTPPKFDLVIVDEAHHIRNTATYAYRAVNRFCDAAEAVLLITRGPVKGQLFLFAILTGTGALVCFVLWYLMNRTAFGMRLRACGENPQAVDAAGGNVTGIRWKAVMISGALCGIGGICFAYSMIGNFSPSIYQGFGYLAIAAMIFGNWKIGPTTLACLIFGLAKSGGLQLCIAAKLPSNYMDLFLMLPYILTLLLLVFFSKKNHPPKAVGEPFDKSKR